LVARYAREIAAGRWKPNGETIKFTMDGVLLDGQHRLAAVALAGVGIETTVVWGLDPDCFDTIDSGRPRSAADMLAIQGIPNRFSNSRAAFRHGELTIREVAEVQVRGLHLLMTCSCLLQTQLIS
jgi:hypothetical protein